MKSSVFLAIWFVASIASIATAGPTVPGAARPTTLLISIDGYRWDYPEVHPSPAIRALIKRGVRAEGLIPSYPSYTFPNHYSIVTGLRPESHGIISNDMFDPEWSAWFSIGSHPAAREGRWWGGEPIWLTATRQGRTSASYFWPGSEADINGEHPTWWYRYDGSVPFEKRLPELMRWLTLPEGERPAVVTFYFEEVDHAGHTFGPRDPRTGDAVAKVDREIARIVKAIKRAGLTESVDVILVSDHGMTESSFDRTFVLSEYLAPDDAQIDFRGSFAGIRPKGLDADTIIARLRGASPHIQIYRKDEIPERLHFRASSRIPEILLIADEGWQIERTPSTREYYEQRRRGSHGFDNALPSMRGIFIAAGPSFPKGRKIPAFENIHIYNLLCAIEGLTPAPNEGDDRLVRWILKGETR
jgi:predicted AlkP superfamily pyrophosphatase or phosphodiesterase